MVHRRLRTAVRLALVAAVALSLCVLGASAQQQQEAAAAAAEQTKAPSDAVGITFEQTADEVVFDFEVDNLSFSRVHYNTTVRGGETIVKVVFESETDQKFVRLHLANAVLPSQTSATTTEDGAKLTFSKAEPGRAWRNVVNFASDEALQGTLPVNVAGNRVAITAAEFEDLSAVVTNNLEQVEGIQYSEEDVRQITGLFDEAFDMTTPYCYGPSHCVCSLPYVFDGTKCVPGDAWQAFERKIVSQSAVQVQEEEGKPLRVLSEQDLLALEPANFNAIFDTYVRLPLSLSLFLSMSDVRRPGRRREKRPNDRKIEMLTRPTV